MNCKELLLHRGKQLFLLQELFHISAILKNSEAITCGKSGVQPDQNSRMNPVSPAQHGVVRAYKPIFILLPWSSKMGMPLQDTSPCWAKWVLTLSEGLILLVPCTLTALQITSGNWSQDWLAFPSFQVNYKMLETFFKCLFLCSWNNITMSNLDFLVWLPFCWTII